VRWSDLTLTLVSFTWKKSSLINGIIDEMPATSETVVTTKGTISYVAQHAFILNTTLRENILFGRPFDRELYERVLDACCLRTDIKLLGRARDLTEIGERGVTLSGGKPGRKSSSSSAFFFSCPLSNRQCRSVSRSEAASVSCEGCLRPT
jgi:ABC-type transport system involved in cytochrome bd biosynthesis fused ATPase/permease subunit